MALILLIPLNWSIKKMTGSNLKQPRVVSINISFKKGIPKQPVQVGELVANYGLKDDAHAGDWHRQVSLLGQESIEKMAALGIKDLTPGKFAENITTENITLYELKIGAKLRIGDAILEVTQIGKECHQKCAIFNQIGECIMPNEGIFTRVLQCGLIHPGDLIFLVDN